jgi:glucose/arabinose dehydrogenase
VISIRILLLKIILQVVNLLVQAVFLRLSVDGKPILKEDKTGVLGDKYPLNLYYAYGIRNSFGIDFDPVTGYLWDTENGEIIGDEINLVKP